MILIRGNVEREADGAIAEKLMKDGFRPLEEEGAAEAVPSETVEKNLDELKTLAKEKGLTGVSSLAKKDLLEILKG